VPGTRLRLQQQVDALVSDLAEAKPVVQAPGRVEPLDVHVDRFGGDPGVG
jgi:hypothetical protein